MAKLHAMLRAYEPGKDGPWGTVEAAHLLNRAGFGGTEAEVAAVVEAGPEAAVDRLLSFPNAPASEQQPVDVPDLSSIEGYPRSARELRDLLAGKSTEERMLIRQRMAAAQREALAETGRWWLQRMVAGRYPLQEKLTLFWHGHFTTSARDERSSWLMWQQNELLRANAAGSFFEFVRRISRDPAMLDYLNNQQNRKGRPNENYARELMELFTLGIGNYTEQDIKEAARAFTGWGHDGEQFIFRAQQHDFGPKTFFGQTGNFDGDDIIRLIFKHPQAPRYITRKLWEYFAYEEPEPEIVEGLAAVLKESDAVMRPVLRTILRSRAFYSPRAIGTQVKSPVQLVVGTVRLLGTPLPTSRMLTNAFNQMGQVLFFPPTVKGWPSGRAWINTSTLFVRYNTCVWLAGGDSPGAPRRRGIERLAGARRDADFEATGGSDAGEVVDRWVRRLIGRPIAAEKRAVLIESLEGRPNREETVRRMVQLIVSMPEYQLC